MTEPNKTRAYIALFAKDEHGFGFGCELMDDLKNEVYHIFSVYLPYNDYPTKRNAIHRMIPTILAEIPDDHTAVTVYATMLQFRNSRELIRKNSHFAPGKILDFKEVRRTRVSAVSLAIDSVQRRNSITERL